MKKPNAPIRHSTSPNRIMRHLAGAALLLTPACCVPCSARAAVYVWNGLGATANWSDPNNWSFQPRPPTNGDTLIFPPFQPRPNNTNDIASLTLDQIRILGSNYILNGNAFTLTNSLVMTNVGLSGASIIEVASLNLGTTDLNTLVGSGATLTLGTIVNGDAGIVKTGPGTLH